MNVALSALLRELNNLVALFSWLTVRYEYSDKLGVYVVSYDVPQKEIDNDEFYNYAFEMERRLSAEFLDNTPLFCDNERLFELSPNAKFISGNSSIVESTTFNNRTIPFPIISWIGSRMSSVVEDVDYSCDLLAA